MKRRDEVLVGVFTTAAAVLLVLGSIWLVQGGLSKGYPLYSTFNWGAGLKQGQPVWLSGVTVGFVDDVDFRQDGRLVVTFAIDDEYRVPLGTTASVVPNGFFGDVAIALTPERPNPQSFSPGDTVPSGLGAPLMQTLTARADTIERMVQDILGEARKELVDQRGVSELRNTLVSMNRLTAELSNVVALQSRELQATMVAFRRAASALDSMQIDSTVRQLRATTTSFADLSSELRSTTTRFGGVLDRVEKGDGNVARLLNDSALYNDVRRLVMRIDTLTLDFKRNPRKFINLEIF
jgi:phospholipid/cholesterol/gamma-HCH transport system substrate-binding protein